MTDEPKTILTNPLSQWYRQPKLFVKLPSGGKFYPKGSLDLSISGDYPVYAMTAKDELIFKTPDALLSGQSTVEVIKSCIPAILDPWKMPTLDVDFLLIAIRIASNGQHMEVGSTCPHCEEENSYSIDLLGWIERYNQYTYEEICTIGDITIYLRPYSYREMSDTSIKTMEQQRIFHIINDENMSDEEKMKRFQDSFLKLTNLTVDVVATCISKIETPAGSTSDTGFIKEFINNAEGNVFKKISEHLDLQKNKVDVKTEKVQCGECKELYLLPITMDQSNFFGVRS